MLDDAARVAAADAQHRCQLLVREGHQIVARPVHGGDDPLGGALLDGMDRIAGCRLKHLRHEAVGVTREKIAKRDRLRLGDFEAADRQGGERPAELHHDAAVGGQVAGADDTADRPFAADQNRLHVASILVCDEVRDEAGSAGKVDRLDVVAGLVEKRAGFPFHHFEMRRHQRVIGGP
jgi:hypothetical protein